VEILAVKEEMRSSMRHDPLDLIMSAEECIRGRAASTVVLNRELEGRNKRKDFGVRDKKNTLIGMFLQMYHDTLQTYL
jgi:hypothetical protein